VRNKILFLMLTLGALLSCQKSEELPDESKKPKPKAPLVEVQVVKPTSIVKVTSLVGTVEAKNATTVIAPSDGYIEKLMVTENEWVAKNQTLAVIASQDRLTLLSQSRNKILELEKQIKKATEHNQDTGELNHQLEQAKKEASYAESLFLGIPVMAPMSGAITQKWIESGSAVIDRQNLFTITDLHSLIIKTSVPEEFYSIVKNGLALKTKFNALPGKEFTAKVTLKYQQIDPATRTFPVELQLVRGAQSIAPGMMAQLELVTDKKENIVAVPNDILLVNPKGEAIVFVLQDSVVQRRIVKLGIANDQLTEIDSGVQSGEKIVVRGQELLKDGMKVTVQKPKEKSKEGKKS